MQKPIYRLHRLRADEEGNMFPDGAGWGFGRPELANKVVTIAEINVPDNLGDGDIVVVTCKGIPLADESSSPGRSISYFKASAITGGVTLEELA